MIGYYKNIGKYKITLLIGNSGKIKPFGDVPKRYHDFKDEIDFTGKEWYQQYGYFSLTPFIFIKDLPQISKVISIIWLFFELIIKKSRQ